MIQAKQLEELYNDDKNMYRKEIHEILEKIDDRIHDLKTYINTVSKEMTGKLLDLDMRLQDLERK